MSAATMVKEGTCRGVKYAVWKNWGAAWITISSEDEIRLKDQGADLSLLSSIGDQSPEAVIDAIFETMWD